MDGVLIGLTATLVALTTVLIIYAALSVRSSNRLREAVEKLQKVEEEISEIGLTQIGASTTKEALIPKTFLSDNLEVLESNIKSLPSPSMEGHLRIRWTWDEDALKITYQLNMLPDVLRVLQANARKPELILQRLVSDPVDVLLIRYRAKAQQMAKELLK